MWVKCLFTSLTFSRWWSPCLCEWYESIDAGHLRTALSLFTSRRDRPTTLSSLARSICLDSIVFAQGLSPQDCSPHTYNREDHKLTTLRLIIDTTQANMCCNVTSNTTSTWFEFACMLFHTTTTLICVCIVLSDPDMDTDMTCKSLFSIRPAWSQPVACLKWITAMIFVMSIKVRQYTQSMTFKPQLDINKPHKLN